MFCRHCDGDTDDLLHEARCDGRQGRVEAGLPLLAAGLTQDTRATSTAAAVSVIESKDTQREHVRLTIVRGGRDGRTDLEVQDLLSLDGSSERPRRWELWKQGRIRILRDANGNAVRRLTATGRYAVVWIGVNPS